MLLASPQFSNANVVAATKCGGSKNFKGTKLPCGFVISCPVSATDPAAADARTTADAAAEVAASHYTKANFDSVFVISGKSLQALHMEHTMTLIKTHPSNSMADKLKHMQTKIQASMKEPYMYLNVYMYDNPQTELTADKLITHMEASSYKMDGVFETAFSDIVIAAQEQFGSSARVLAFRQN